MGNIEDVYFRETWGRDWIKKPLVKVAMIGIYL
jgi:hypothetical protein